MQDFLNFHLFFEDEKKYEDLPDNTLILLKLTLGTLRQMNS